MQSTMRWDDVPAELRRNWTALGWSQKLWDAEGPMSERQPSSMNRSWDELNQDEVDAAEALQYHQTRWEGGKLRADGIRQNDIWAEMLPDVRAHWETLGWSASAWDGQPESMFRVDRN